MSVSQQAEHGANFLRTYHPDMDVSAALVKEHIIEASDLTRQLGIFDPYVGNLMESAVALDSEGTKRAYLVFPMGEINCDLNLSPLLFSESGELVFKPNATPVKSFDTPIRQIVPSKSFQAQEGGFIAVRTHGSIVLSKIEPLLTHQCALNDLFTLTSADAGGHTFVDVRPTSELGVYVANNHGALYHGQFSSGLKQLHLLRPPAEDVSQDEFWRIGLGIHPTECTLLSKTNALLLDRRANSSLALFTLTDTSHCFTSLEDEDSNDVFRFCTTNQILWIDKRSPMKPLLGFKHGRKFDRTLRTQTISLEHSLTFLTSRRNSLITSYDVSRTKGSPIYVNSPPYSPPMLLSSTLRNSGHLFFRHPCDVCETRATLFRLSEQGSIQCIDVFAPQNNQNALTRVDWSEAVKALDAKSQSLRVDVGLLGARDRSIVDFSSAYEHIFCKYEENREKAEEEEAEALYEMIEQVPSFWQKADVAEAQVLTAYDILFRAGDEPCQSSRSDFLADCLINSKRGYRALAQGRLSTQTLEKGAAWHYNISSSMKYFIPEATTDVQELINNLSQFDLDPGEERPHQSIQREAWAKEQLALDLTLASGLYSGQSVTKPINSDDELESMTEALSLEGEPPPIQLGYLQTAQHDEGGELQASTTSQVNGRDCAGAHLLLKEWKIGTNPRDYVYCDPYNDTDIHTVPRMPRTKPKPTLELPSPPTTQTVRPPVILASSVLAGPSMPEAGKMIREDVRLQTSVANLWRDDGEPASQILPSTQILPGPYGGRVSKKQAKRRIGGF
ncbi:hypothetical protein AMATHDRAFT_53159 [Amanita thiersii Skay4041]|uniref:RRN6 beta-propeller domain-containing protein n=1 Tax=Amanita thiersii Skay4041 TaxID=703135 RepID=A0A2A9NXP4_9AGAR|nr:hypothetical protein AMATHDRAFT_53159 [Amanita thiersii Skay4041]